MPTRTMVKPNLFLVGSPKCGTTAFAEYLASHPSVFFCSPKEPNFFCRDFAPEYRYYSDLQSYLELFASARGKRYAAEGSVSYLFSRTAVAEALAFNPDARFVAFVRNPLELVVSLHRQQVNNLEEEVQDFAAAWALQPERRQGRSIPSGCREPALLQYALWARQGALIQRFFSIVPATQRFVILFDDLRTDPARVYDDLLHFLDLPHDGRSGFPSANTAFRRRFPVLLRAFVRPQPIVLQRFARVARSLNRGRPLGIYRFLYELLDRYDRRPSSLSKPSQTLYDQLRLEFLDDVALLSRLLRRDLSGWLQ